jgi:Nucleotidyltransferase domain
MVTSPPAVLEFGRQLEALGWVRDLLISGSLATGDYVPGVSDLDLVALVDGPVDDRRQTTLVALHRQLDAGAAAGLNLGCVYVDAGRCADVRRSHPTWTHGSFVQRILSGIARAELVRHGYAIFGRSPRDVLPAMNNDDIRAAARAELTGYWAWAARRPWLWLDPVIADLGLTSMARGRHALRAGDLLTKSQAIEQADAPAWLIDQLRARRRGEHVASPRLRTALVAWRDARRTIARIHSPDPPDAG